MVCFNGFDTYTTKCVEDTVQLGRSFAESPEAKLDRNSVVLMYGEMGAGKTHFVKGMALGLGIDALVTSPTFALMNEYCCSNGSNGNDDKAPTLYHFDLYRIRSLEELNDIGFFDCVGNGVVAAEWAANIDGLNREFGEYYVVGFTKNEKNDRERKICIDFVRT